MTLIASHLLGQRGEEIAASYLQTKGYVIRERNVRFGCYEIDLVAHDPREQMIVFAEVKTRKSHSNNYPISRSFTRRKRTALYHGLFLWISEHQYDGPFRIDLLSVHRGCVVEHYKDVGKEYI